MNLLKLFFIALSITVVGYLFMGEQKPAASNAPAASLTAETNVSTQQLPANMSGETAVTRFNIVTKLEPDNRLFLKLDSDAPDSLNLYVMVYRTYKRLDGMTKKTEEEYLAYHEPQLSAGELKAGKTYVLDLAEWKKEFAKRQADSGPLQIKLLQNTISKNVTVSVGLSKNESLGSGNAKLNGAAVTKTTWGDKTLEAEKTVAVALGGAPKRVASLNPNNLDIGQRYITGQLNTPLMPHYAPANKMAAIAQTKQLPAGTPFKVLRRKTFNDEVWYEVSADFNTFNLTGWINSMAISAPGAITDR